MSPVGLATKYPRASESQQQFTKMDWLVSQWQATALPLVKKEAPFRNK